MPDEGKLARCVRLLTAFHHRGELATRDAASMLEVDTQTARRDIRSLVEAGVPIEAVGEGVRRRYRLDPAYRRGGLQITQGDAFALHFGRQFLRFLEGTAVSDWLDELREKLEPSMPRLTLEREDQLARRLVFLSEPYRPYGPHDEVLDTVIAALLTDRVLALDYRAEEDRSYQDVHPLALVVYRRALYLLCHVPGYKRPLRLALERIGRVERTPATFDYPKDFDPRAELSRSYGIVDDGGDVHVVRLRFDRRVARLVRSRVWHATQEVLDLEDGSVELRMRTCGPELARLVMEFGETVEVIEPGWLRERVVEELRHALEKYDPEPTR